LLVFDAGCTTAARPKSVRTPSLYTGESLLDARQHDPSSRLGVLMMVRLVASFVLVLASGLAWAEAITIKAGGLDRTAVYFKPIKKGVWPLVIAFHGHGGNGADFAEKTDLHAQWPEATMYFPDGLPTATGSDPEGDKPGWQKAAGVEGDRDLALFDAILKREGIKQGRGVKRKVYLAGFSNGASLTFLLWSVRRSSITAVAACAAGGQGKDLSPMPAVLIYGKDDDRCVYTKAIESIKAVLAANKATGSFSDWPNGRVIESYPAARGGATTRLITHPGGHSWPEWASDDVVTFLRAQ